MRTPSIFAMLLVTTALAHAEEPAPSRIDSITKSARGIMPAMPALPSVSLPSMPDLCLPDFSDATGRVMSEFNTFTQQVGDAELADLADAQSSRVRRHEQGTVPAVKLGMLEELLQLVDAVHFGSPHRLFHLGQSMLDGGRRTVEHGTEEETQAADCHDE